MGTSVKCEIVEQRVAQLFIPFQGVIYVTFRLRGLVPWTVSVLFFSETGVKP